MHSILIQINLPAELHDKRKEKSAKIKISQLAQNKYVNKFYQVTNNCESSGFPQIYHTRSCITA